MKVMIHDLQCDRCLGDGEVFNNLLEVRDRLIDYHSIDVDINWLSSVSLYDIFEVYEWALITEDEKIITIDEYISMEVKE